MSMSLRRSWLLVVLIGSVAGSVAVFAGVRVDRADAYVSAPNPVTTDWGAVRTLLVAPPSGEALAGSVSPEAKKLLHGGRVAAGLRPSVSVMLRSTGAVPLLAQSAVLVGYKVGGYVNRWLGISVAILGTTNDLKTFSGCSIWVDRWTFFPAGTDGWGPDRYQARFTQNCGGSIAVGQPIWDVPSNPVHQARVAAVDALFADKFPLGAKHDFGIWFNYYIPAVSVETSAKVVADEPLTTQWYTASATAAIVNAILANINNDPGSSSPTADDVRAVLLSGSDTTDLEIGKLVHTDWEGAPFTWFDPLPGEAFPVYEARLRAAGWLGSSTVVQLDGSQGDIDFGLGGVPCTSVPPSTTVGTGSGATSYLNPTSGTFGDDTNPTNGQTCGGATPTSYDEPECSFHQIVGSWQVIQLANPLFYHLACEQARAYLASLNPFLPDGTINPTVVGIEDLIAESQGIYGSVPKAHFGQDIDEWQKVVGRLVTPGGLEYFGGVPEAPHQFEIHFYRNSATDKADLSIEYKIRFRHYFAP